MTTHPEKKNIPIQQVLAALMDDQHVFPPAYLRHFSDLEGRDLEAVRSIWPQVSARRRFTLLEDLEDLSEADTLVSFTAIARMALEDADARVRTVAIRMLWEADDVGLADVFMRMLEQDESAEVRAAAASALGIYVYEGELEEISEDIFRRVERRLIAVVNSQEEDLVRRRALESLGFSSHPEVPALIRNAYASGNTDWSASALFAMGRSADTSWEPDVIRMLQSPKADIQLEAVRAAGALAIARSRRILLDLLEEEAQDSEIREAVIWSLSQIGGDEVRDTLEELLENTEDDEEAEILEDALDNLSFTEDTGLYGFFDFDQLGQTNKEIDDIEEYLDNEHSDEEESNLTDDPPRSSGNQKNNQQHRHRKDK
jgi:HEAT repeat protein